MNNDKIKLAKKAKAAFFVPQSSYRSNISVWGSAQVDKLSFEDHDTFVKIVKDCRFFFRHEPIATTVVTKMVGLAINDIIIPQEELSKTDYQIYKSLRNDVIKFIRKASLEFLTTGLVVPEITLTTLNRKQLREKGIQRLDSLLYPTNMWLRNAQDIIINRPFITDKESYFLQIPDDVTMFIQTKGTYEDGSKDVELYTKIVTLYPEFVAQVAAGDKKILLDNPLIIKSTILSDSQYPIPYLYPGLESFKHKRNLKRMDYSIAARVISAILHVTAGNDNFPLTEDQEETLDDLEQKFRWRDGFSTEEVERVFTLFTNHTVTLDWVFPDVEALLNDKKYDAVNKDIILALGFPRILITGETERSFTSDPEIATLSPTSTMEIMRDALMPIIHKIFYEVKEQNELKSDLPDIEFTPINLLGLRLYYEGLSKLYDTGNLSRTSYAKSYGYDISEEFAKKEEEKKMLKTYGLDEEVLAPGGKEQLTIKDNQIQKQQKLKQDQVMEQQKLKQENDNKQVKQVKPGAPVGNDNGKQA
jgi:hypothetical protein